MSENTKKISNVSVLFFYQEIIPALLNKRNHLNLPTPLLPLHAYTVAHFFIQLQPLLLLLFVVVVVVVPPPPPLLQASLQISC